MRISVSLVMLLEVQPSVESPTLAFPRGKRFVTANPVCYKANRLAEYQGWWLFQMRETPLVRTSHLPDIWFETMPRFLTLRGLCPLLLWVIGLAIFFFPASLHAQSNDRTYRVLVLYWDNKDFPGNVMFDESFKAALRQSPYSAISSTTRNTWRQLGFRLNARTSFAITCVRNMKDYPLT